MVIDVTSPLHSKSLSCLPFLMLLTQSRLFVRIFQRGIPAIIRVEVTVRKENKPPRVLRRKAII